MSPTVRHITVPERRVGRQLVVAQPNTGAPIVLNETAMVMWELMGTWRHTSEVAASLGEIYPDIPPASLFAAVNTVIAALEEAGLLEHAP